MSHVSRSDPLFLGFACMLAYAHGTGFFDGDDIRPEVVKFLQDANFPEGVKLKHAIEGALSSVASEKQTPEALKAAYHEGYQDALKDMRDDDLGPSGCNERLPRMT